MTVPPRPPPFPLESLDTSDEIELTRLRHGLVSVVPQHAKGEIREVPEQGESAQGREDAHDIGHMLHPVPETVAGHGCLPGGPSPGRLRSVGADAPGYPPRMRAA